MTKMQAEHEACRICMTIVTAAKLVLRICVHYHV